MIYKINASDVAAIIGKNKFKPRNEVFEQIAIEHGILECEESNILDEVQTNLCEEIKDVLVSNTAIEVEKSMQIFERHTEKLIIKDIIHKALNETPILSSQVKTPEDVQTVINSICKNTDSSNSALEEAIKNPTIKKFIKESKEIVESVKSINTLRGQKLEEKSTDAYESTSGVKVKSRNSKCYIYAKNNWKIAGRVDGLTDDAVVETKTRRRFWPSPPEYDIIQLRCYMKLCSKKVGILNEQFPNNTSRETRIDWDENIWQCIENDIDLAITDFETNYPTS